MEKYTIRNFDAQFPNDDACLEFVRHKRWPARMECSSCHKTSKFHRVRSRKVFECDYCGYQVSPTAGTILHKSPTPLRSWFYAVFLMSSTRTGISAKQLERELGVTYKTAWRMFSQIRKLMAQDGGPLFGQIEIDETYIGGKDVNRHESKRAHVRGRGAGGKTIAVGLVERGGKAVVKVIPNVTAKELIPIITEHIPISGTTTIFTDELHSYDRLAKLGYEHERVMHVAKQYVRGTAHVNNVESLWSTVKRGMDGVHHSVSPQHLQSYLDSYVYRFNHRQDEAPMFVQLLGQVPSASGTLLP